MAGGGEDVKTLPKRSERKDYKAMNDGLSFGDDGEEASFRASAEKFANSQKTEGYDDQLERKARENAQRAAEEMLRMREEYEALDEEEDFLRRQRAEADDLRQKLAKKREVVSQLRDQVKNPPLHKCVIVSDSMAKYVEGIRQAKIQSFPGINVARLTHKICQGMVDLSAALVILHVGTNDITGCLTEKEIKASYNDLISAVRKRSSAQVLVSAIIPRPIDFDTNGTRVKNVNKELADLCLTRRAKFLRTFKPFLKGGEPRREYFAIRDGGLHLNNEGTRRLTEFFINTIAHL